MDLNSPNARQRAGVAVRSLCGTARALASQFRIYERPWHVYRLPPGTTVPTVPWYLGTVTGTKYRGTKYGTVGTYGTSWYRGTGTSKYQYHGTVVPVP